MTCRLGLWGLVPGVIFFWTFTVEFTPTSRYEHSKRIEAYGRYGRAEDCEAARAVFVRAKVDALGRQITTTLCREEIVGFIK